MTSESEKPVFVVGRRHTLALLGLAGVAAMVKPAYANTPVGKVVTVDGSVALERATASIDVAPDDPLMLEDRLMTREDGFALLLLNDRTQINLGAGSDLTIDQFIVDQGGVISMGGAILFDRPADLPPTDITILTAFAQIGVRGTRFFAGPSNDRFSVFVDHGTVSVTAAGVERILSDGDGVDFVAEGEAPGPVVKWGAARIEAALASVRAGRAGQSS